MRKTSSALALLLLAAALLGAIGWKSASRKPAAQPPDGTPVACTMDAKICPDGSAVGRVPPACQFAACPEPSPPAVVPVEPAIPVAWKTSDSADGLAFSYPETLGLAYVSPVDWPPSLWVRPNVPFSCLEAGLEEGRAGRTQALSIGGRAYCATRVNEGAAGSLYAQYAYVFSRGLDLVALAFTLRFPQCGNYDDPQKTACEREQAGFDVDRLADGIVRTVRPRP